MNRLRAVLLFAGLALGAMSVQVKAEDKPEPVKVVLCKEHGVPEDVCVLCHPKLAANFKKSGDWCKEHKVAESQCFQCHPELEKNSKQWLKGKKWKKTSLKRNELPKCLRRRITG